MLMLWVGVTPTRIQRIPQAGIPTEPVYGKQGNTVAAQRQNLTAFPIY